MLLPIRKQSFFNLRTILFHFNERSTCIQFHENTKLIPSQRLSMLQNAKTLQIFRSPEKKPTHRTALPITTPDSKKPHDSFHILRKKKKSPRIEHEPSTDIWSRNEIKSQEKKPEIEYFEKKKFPRPFAFRESESG